MEIRDSQVKGLKHTYKATISADKIESTMQTRLVEAGSKVKIDGFRPGKAPMDLVKKRFEESVRPEVLRDLLDETVQKIIKDKNLRAAGRPSVDVDSYNIGSAMEITVSLEVLPDIKDVDLSKVKFEKLVAKADDKIVDDRLAELAKNNKKTQPLEKDRSTKKGDTVTIDFVGRTEEGPFKGGSAKGVNLELGSNHFIPGFEDQLIGWSKGDKKTIQVTFPKDYGSSELKGKKAEFDVELTDIQETIIPTPDDAFAKTLGVKDLAELKSMIGNVVQGEYDRMSFMIAKRRTLDALDSVKIDVPETLTKNEFKHIWNQTHPHNHDHCDHEHDHCDFEDEVKKADPKEIKEMETIAERRVRLGLLLAEIGRSHKVDVTKEELEKAIWEQARRYPGQSKQVYEYYQKNQSAIQSLRAPIFEDKVIEVIVKEAGIKDKVVPFATLEKEFKEVTEDN